MKKEYFIFLVLIVAAAVITGSTIGFASNFDVLTSQLNQPQIASLDKPLVNADDITVNPNNEPSPSDELIINISEQEQDQILEMLQALGMINSNDYSQFIKEFQAKHSLNPTGNLDSRTLNIIIEQVKFEKTSRSLNESR